MSLILYTDRCLACFHKKRMHNLHLFAHTYSLELVTKRISYDKQWAAEAKSKSTLPLPFMYNETNGHSVEFMSDNWEELLIG